MDSDRLLGAIILFFVVIGGIGMITDTVTKSHAKRDIIIACYNSGKTNCDDLWGKPLQ
jgi:hypothetical protein